MDQQIKPKIEDQQQGQQEENEQELYIERGSFVLPGHIITNQITANLHAPNVSYNSSVYKQIQGKKLLPLYAGYPTICQVPSKNGNKEQSKETIASLIRFSAQYLPSKNDLVIGVIKMKASEHFVVDIGAPLDGIIGGLEFDGATKRNKPNIAVGGTIFCRVTEYSKYMGARLSCLNKGYNSENSVSRSGESASKGNNLGELKGGIMTYASLHRHSQIKKDWMEKIGKCAKFEVVFGRNGRVWINSASPHNTNIICNIIKVIEERGFSEGSPIATSMISLLK